jgi:soluble lytic murein transglycosylase-like protein
LLPGTTDDSDAHFVERLYDGHAKMATMRTRALVGIALALALACRSEPRRPLDARAALADKHAADAAIAALERRIGDERDPAELRTLVDALATEVERARRAAALVASVDATAAAPPGDPRLHAVLATLDADTYALPPSFAARVLAHVDELERAPAKPDELAARARVWPTVAAELAAANLPESLAYVAYVESRWDASARSPADAVGLWQLREGTAERLGLRVGRVDERADVTASTRAAARLITRLAASFDADSLLVALVAYQLGDGRVRSIIEDAGNEPGGWRRSRRGFWALYRLRRWPDEVDAYLPKLLAAAIVRR